jgi:hypothetical protein
MGFARYANLLYDASANLRIDIDRFHPALGPLKQSQEYRV